jgi:coiled-coil domain-containing protein 34
MNEKSEKEMRAEVNRKEWLKLKRNEEKVKNELAARLVNEKVQRKQEEQPRIQEKVEESYEKWLEAKENERKEQIENKKMSKRERKENELQRKQQSDEAYKIWLEKSKQHQKLQNNHFGYIGGKVTGYYDWTTYPMPSYNNPNPWVSPKVRTRYQSKIKLQNPSPPLLFKELEERERKTKQRQNVKMKRSGNSVC